MHPVSVGNLFTPRRSCKQLARVRSSRALRDRPAGAVVVRVDINIILCKVGAGVMEIRKNA